MDLAVLQLHRHLNLDLAIGGGQDGGHVVFQPEPLGGLAEPVRDDLVVGDLGALWLIVLFGLLGRLVRFAVTVGLGVGPTALLYAGGTCLLGLSLLWSSMPSLRLPGIGNRQSAVTRDQA